MGAMAGTNPFRLDFDGRVEEYGRHRRIHPEVLRQLLESGLFGPATRMLDVGCGTGNYAAALTESTKCLVSGIDPSQRMLDSARASARWESLAQGNAESLPFRDDSFDVVMSTDLIHHVKDRDAYFREAVRVLRTGGHVVTVTDSHDTIARRRCLARLRSRRYRAVSRPVILLAPPDRRRGFSPLHQSLGSRPGPKSDP